jgi:acyl-CoA synthetase (AMP-forming)/AMP-acid ligase II
MKWLAEKLEKTSSKEVLWISQKKGMITAGMINSFLKRINYAGLQNKCIALDEMDDEELLLALVALDGIAKVILILPPEDDLIAKEKRLTDAGIEVLLKKEFFDLSKNSLLDSEFVGDVNYLPRYTKWLLPTSGTSGISKLIPHDFLSLTESIVRRDLGEKYIWSSLYSFRRFAGLQVFLQSWFCNTELILNNSNTNLTNFLFFLVKQNCNALSGTPSMWRKLAMHPNFKDLKLKQITLGGEIVDQTILNTLANAFPGARITHIYASTEAGVGFAVRDGRAGFPIEFLTSSPGLSDIKVNSDGHLLFRSKALYEAIERSESQWIDSGDKVIVEEDRVKFLGRANGSINVGGNKVMPEEVESIIQELPEVAFALVRARQSTLMGSLVEAIVLPTHDLALDAFLIKKIISHCRARLEPFKVPAFISQAKDIEISSSGKLIRRNIE